MSHIFLSDSQPATSFVDDCDGTRHRCTNPPGRLLWCRKCGKRRPARNLIVQCYYDDRRYFCVKGKGCKQ